MGWSKNSQRLNTVHNTKSSGSANVDAVMVVRNDGNLLLRLTVNTVDTVAVGCWLAR